MFRRTPPRPLRPTVGNTVGLITRFSGSDPINLHPRRGGECIAAVSVERSSHRLDKRRGNKNKAKVDDAGTKQRTFAIVWFFPEVTRCEKRSAKTCRADMAHIRQSWPGLSGESPFHLPRCSLSAEQRAHLLTLAVERELDGERDARLEGDMLREREGEGASGHSGRARHVLFFGHCVVVNPAGGRGGWLDGHASRARS